MFHPYEKWPPEARSDFESFFRALQEQERPFAIFDADNTLYHGDIEESLLVYLEEQGVLEASRMSECLEVVPRQKDESLLAYLYRLGSIDIPLAYRWNSQIFSGLTLAEIKSHLNTLLHHRPQLRARYRENNSWVDIKVPVPTVYPGQQHLIRMLKEAGVEIWVITASLEDLVRLFVSDPRYGLDIDPLKVIGLNCQLQDPETGTLVSGRARIYNQTIESQEFFTDRYLRQIVTPHVRPPEPSFVGKLSAMKQFIHPFQKPMLVAGDTINDFWMLNECNVEAGGLRLFVKRDKRSYKEFRTALAQIQDKCIDKTQYDALSKNWIHLTPQQLL
jgi:phosphorylcholine phosphatase